MGQTAKKVVTTAAGLIALYLAVAYSSGFSKNVSSAATGSVSLVKAFQGR